MELVLGKCYHKDGREMAPDSKVKSEDVLELIELLSEIATRIMQKSTKLTKNVQFSTEKFI